MNATALSRTGQVGIADLERFDEIIDVRSPGEFAEDHIPGALNCPVLDDAQRAEVGTLYTQASPFAAKKLGAALIARNIGDHLLSRFIDRPKTWKPVVYCWRGGMRSAALVTVLRSVGWAAGQLDGGYKTYRRAVIERLEELPSRFAFRVLCGPTGSAKTRILQALGERGEQIVDLEALACHKGSVLGVLPDQPQPSQKWFESALTAALAACDPARPVYVEAESRKIGRLQIPESLLRAMRGARCLVVEAEFAARVDFLLRDYAYFIADPGLMKARLQVLQGIQSKETLAHWAGLADEGIWPTLVGELLAAHYDPLYHRSQGAHFAGFADPQRYATADLSAAGISELAGRIAAKD